MRPRIRHQLYKSVLEALWDGSSKITYDNFVQGLLAKRKKMRARSREELTIPSPATFTRIWRDFCHNKGLQSSSPRHIKRVLLQGISEGAWDPGASVKENLPIASAYLARHHIIPPGATVLLRLLRTVRRRFRRTHQQARERVLAQAFGNTLSSLPIARKFQVAKHILRYPPVLKGKVGLPKLEAESTYRHEIEATFKANRLSIEEVLTAPGIEEAFEFVDRQANSTLRRWERREVVHTLPLYLAARHQQAIDAILFVFVRLARLLRFRIKTRFDEQLHDTSRALFERRGGEFAALRRVVLATLEGGDPRALHRFQSLLRSLEEQGEAMHSQEGYYKLLASRGTFARKLARRLQGVPLVGRDPHARAIVAALDEVLRFAPFAESVPMAVRRQLTFLDVPTHKLANRRVFETIVLITVADLLWLGRVTSPRSRRFGNRWESVGESASDSAVNAVRDAIHDVRQRLHMAWAELGDAATTSPLVKNGRLVSRRPARKRLKEDETRRQHARKRFLENRRPVSIVKVLLDVHKATSMLDAFQAPPSARHRLAPEQRTRLALAVVLARGMNVGITQMATLLGRWYTIGRLTNFDEGYVTVRNLLQANRILLDAWDKRRLGRIWGSGQGAVADGRSVAASERTLLAGYHFRHQRSGVTLYWLVRDDWIAARVGVIGNYEWESWYLLDGLLAPTGGHPPDWATGDTHGQHLALWGLSCLMGKDIRARFRQLSHVKLYHDRPVSVLPVRGVQRINWHIVDRAIPSLARLVVGIRDGRVFARDVLRTWNIIDEHGMNVTEALRELGKAVRTAFILRYAMNEALRKEIQLACNRIESWNSFQEAVFWGHGGRLRTTDPMRQDVNALCMQLLMNAIVFYNAKRYGRIFRNIEGSSPAVWEHIRMLGDYRITLTRRNATGTSEI